MQRDALFEKVRNGEVRVILGSTQKLGTGTNIQDKLIKAHHIDCPWKPSDLTQREGRILRQGNENKTVAIARYVIKGTFDSYLWQIQEQKLTYIAQIMNGNNINRSMDDLDETILTAAEVKAVATDNPLLAEKMSIDNDVSRLQLIRSQYESSRSRMTKNIQEVYLNKLSYLGKVLSQHQEDLEILNQHSLANEFKIKISGKTFDNRKEAFKEIYARSLLFADGETQVIGEFRGLELQLNKAEIGEDILSLKGKKTYHSNFIPKTESGNMTRLGNIPLHVQQIINDIENDIKNIEVQLEIAKNEVEKPFTQQDKLDQLLKKQRKIDHKIKLDTIRKETGEEKARLVQESSEEMIC